MGLLGIPSQDQINQILDSALSKVQGVEAQTAADLKAAIAAELAGLTQFEQKVATDIPAAIQPAVDAISRAVDEITAVRKLIASGLTVKFGGAQ